jgi:4-hydroxy-tetrahydrodipicolinate synthase
MTKKLITGVSAAVGTPRRPDGSLDETAFRNTLQFLMDRGIQGFAINGATGEFCLSAKDELRAMLAVAAEVTQGRAQYICGIGAAGIQAAIENGFIAIEGGANGLLLPMPYFFRYSQTDLEAFCRRTAEELPAPILLYNLPQFASGLEPETVRRLVREVPNVVGIKDSSGSLDILRALSEPGMEACRIVGNDGALVPAMREAVCDGVVSGVASVLPELILSIYGNGRISDSEAFRQSQKALDEFITAIDALPVPWGLKWIGEVRGIAAATFAQPVSKDRASQGTALQEWFRHWGAQVYATV